MANPMALSMLVSHIFQHVSLEAQNLADQQMPEPPQQMPPQMQEGGMMQPPPPNPKKEILKAQLEAQILEPIMPRLEEIITPPDDGVVALKQQELEIRARENQDDKLIAEKKIQLDKAKLKQKDQSEEEKIKSQEDIEALKATVERERIKQEKKSGSKD